MDYQIPANVEMGEPKNLIYRSVGLLSCKMRIREQERHEKREDDDRVQYP